MKETVAIYIMEWLDCPLSELERQVIYPQLENPRENENKVSHEFVTAFDKNKRNNQI